MRSRLRSTPADWPLAGRAALLLMLAPVCLRLVPRWTMGRACAVSSAGPPHPPFGRPAAAIDRIVAVIATLGRVPVLRGTCLSRAVVGLVLARRAGLNPALVIGVSRSGSSLSAHAWLEHAGRTLPAQDVDGYAPLWSSR